MVISKRDGYVGPGQGKMGLQRSGLAEVFCESANIPCYFLFGVINTAYVCLHLSCHTSFLLKIH